MRKRTTLRVLTLGLCLAAPVWAAADRADTANAAVGILEPALPFYAGIPIPLQLDNAITQALGGRALNLDLYGGEFLTIDDNIFGSSQRRKHDAIWTSMGGLKMRYTTDEYNYGVAGQLMWHEFDKYGDESDWEGNIGGDVALTLSPAVALRAYGTTARTSIPRGPDLPGVEQRDDYTAGAVLTLLPTDSFGVDIGYDYYTKDNRENGAAAQEYYDQAAWVKPAYALTDNAQVYVRLTEGWVRYDANPVISDGEYTEGVLGYFWKYRDTMSLNIEGGIQHREYDPARRGIEIDDVTGQVIRGNGVYAFSREWAVGASVVHQPGEASDDEEGRIGAVRSNYVVRTSWSPYLQYRPTARLRCLVGPSWTHGNPENGPSYDVRGLSLSVSYAFTDWLSAGASYTYGKTEYDTGGNSRSRNRVNLGLMLMF